jgi:hypothetical protein
MTASKEQQEYQKELKQLQKLRSELEYEELKRFEEFKTIEFLRAKQEEDLAQCEPGKPHLELSERLKWIIKLILIADQRVRKSYSDITGDMLESEEPITPDSHLLALTIIENELNRLTHHIEMLEYQLR